MPARPVISANAARLLAELGERLRLARLRRRLSAQEVAGRAGITRPTLQRLESGEPAATLGTAIKVMGVLGVAEEVALLAREDAKGWELLDARLPARRSASIGPIRLAGLPQLRELAWHLVGDDVELTPEEAFELYERNWRYIERDKLEPREARLIERLTRTVGKGVMLV